MSNQGFDVLTEGLQGKKLIEASAGTGKTYSIAILVLRIILEKDIPIEKILMVTFTKAAVAELETRIRKFIRTGFKYMSGREDLDEGDNIRKVIENADKSIEEKKDLLSKAVQNLDNLSVMTIHSFCQKTIDEFTFETNQSFDFEIVTDETDLLKNESNRYLREVLNVMNLETFKGIRKSLDFQKMHELIGKHLMGMKFIDSRPDEDLSIEELKQEIISRRGDLDSFIENKFTEIISKGIKSNALLTEAIAGNIEEFKRRFRDQINKPAKYFVNFEFMKADFLEYEKAIKDAEDEFINYFYHDFFKRADEEIHKIKQNRGYISYNDQIKTVNEVSESEVLQTKLLDKYQAIFIDEFQDTDKHQYEIFNNVFTNVLPESSKKSIIYYIGDPKQSIYGWRGSRSGHL